VILHKYFLPIIAFDVLVKNYYIILLLAAWTHFLSFPVYALQKTVHKPQIAQMPICPQAIVLNYFELHVRYKMPVSQIPSIAIN